MSFLRQWTSHKKDPPTGREVYCWYTIQFSFEHLICLLSWSFSMQFWTYLKIHSLFNEEQYGCSFWTKVYSIIYDICKKCIRRKSLYKVLSFIFVHVMISEKEKPCWALENISFIMKRQKNQHDIWLFTIFS